MSAVPALPDDLERRVLVQYAVSSALARSDTVEEAASSVIGEIGRHLDWNAGSCWLLDPLSERLEAVASWPDSEQPGPFRQATQRIHLAKGEGLPGRVWQSGKVEWI